MYDFILLHVGVKNNLFLLKMNGGGMREGGREGGIVGEWGGN